MSVSMAGARASATAASVAFGRISSPLSLRTGRVVAATSGA
jgi:hypothetical protein